MTQRAKLDFSKCTPVTPDTFAEWKRKQKGKKETEIKEKAAASAKKHVRSLPSPPGRVRRGISLTHSLRSYSLQGGKLFGMSGRALFTFDPTLFVDDDDAQGADAYEYDEEITRWAETAEADRVGNGKERGEEKKEKVHNGGKSQVAEVQDASLFLDDEDLPDEEED